eukprot:646847-Rhodomonas_salina.1
MKQVSLIGRGVFCRWWSMSLRLCCSTLPRSCAIMTPLRPSARVPRHPPMFHTTHLVSPTTTATAQHTMVTSFSSHAKDHRYEECTPFRHRQQRQDLVMNRSWQRGLTCSVGAGNACRVPLQPAVCAVRLVPARQLRAGMAGEPLSDPRCASLRREIDTEPSRHQNRKPCAECTCGVGPCPSV